MKKSSAKPLGEMGFQEANDRVEEVDYSESEDSAEEVQNPLSRTVLEEIGKFEDSFKDITKQYRIIDRIGEGACGVHQPVLALH